MWNCFPYYCRTATVAAKAAAGGAAGTPPGANKGKGVKLDPQAKAASKQHHAAVALATEKLAETLRQANPDLNYVLAALISYGSGKITFEILLEFSVMRFLGPKQESIDGSRAI
eukprot:COSAG02_NODE_47264_length_342_cov_1.053498_1_plen_113_part_11